MDPTNRKGNTMNNKEIADLIKARFTPFAFTCDCKGTHPACYATTSGDTYAIAQNDTVTRIAAFIEGLEPVIKSLSN